MMGFARVSVRRWLAVLAVVAASGLVTPAAAQRGREGRRGGVPDRAVLEERFRAQMGQMLRERLELTDDEAIALTGVMRDFDMRRRELGRSEQATRRRVEALMLEGGEDEEEAGQLLARLAELRALESQLFQEEQTALLEVLSPVQVLRMQSFREQMGQRIRQLRGRNGPAGQRRRPGGGEGRPGGDWGWPLGGER